MENKNIVLLFGGQGSQSVGMGKEFFKTYQQVKERFELASEILKEDMAKLCFEENDKLNLTQYTQTAIFLVSACIYEIFCKELEAPYRKVAYGLGHSLGEFSALFSTGALGFENGLRLVRRRGDLMSETCLAFSQGKGDAGMMVVLGLEDELLEEFCSKKREEGYSLWCANYNTIGQIVLAGLKDDLSALEVEIKGLGAKKTLLLPMSVASHCPILESMQGEFLEILETSIEDSFLFPIISNVTAKPYCDKKTALTLLNQQLVSPVLHRQSIESLKDNADLVALVECGSSVLKGLNKRLTSLDTLSILTPADLEKTIQTLKG